jgi:hypothetical protein
MDEKFFADPEVIGTVLGLVCPGLVSIHVYKLLVPSKSLEWAQALIQGFFFTVINYVLAFPVLLFVVRGSNLDAYPIRYWLAVATIWIVLPVLWPILWKKALSSKPLGKYLQQPYATPWDFYFDHRRSVFMLIHLKNGHLIGGYWGPGSYASAFPEQGDLYLSEVYGVDRSGRFLESQPFTDGLLIRKDEYTYIELFKPATE